MKKITAFLLVFIMTALCFNAAAGVAVYADEGIEILPSVTNADTNEIKIDFNIPEGFSGKELSVYVFNPKTGDENGYGPEDIKFSNPTENIKILQYYTQKTVSESETTVTVDFKLNPAAITAGTKPKYNIFAALDKETFGNCSMFYYDNEAKSGLIDSINNKTADANTLAESVNDYFTLQAFDTNTIVSDNLKFGQNILKLASASVVTKDNIESIYKEAAVLTAAYEGNTKLLLESPEKYKDIIGIDNAYVAELKNIKTSGYDAIAAEVKQDYAKIEDYRKALQQAILTAEVYYYKDDGSGHIANLLSSFKTAFEEMGVDYDLYNASNKTNAAKAVLGAGYVSPGKIGEKINYYAKANPAKTGSSAGSSVGSGGGGGGTSVFIPSAPSSESQIKPETVTFKDLEDVEWAKDYISRLYAEGIVSGDGNGNFLPNDNISRREFVKMIVEAFDIEEGENAALFNDVNAKDWAYKYIARAASAGIVSGYNGSFSPSANITRQDLAVMLVRSLKAEGKLPAASDKGADFADNKEIADYALESISILYKNNIINGDENGNFMPESFATRAEAARMICGVLDMIED